MRWSLLDPNTSETYEMPINPNSMTSPVQDRAIATTYGSTVGTARIRSFVTPTQAIEWSWGGVIRDEAQYDQLVYWSRKPRKVRITDHLNRTFEVLMEAFTPEDRKPTPQTPWRLKYTMKTLLLRRVS